MPKHVVSKLLMPGINIVSCDAQWFSSNYYRIVDLFVERL